MHRIVFTFLCAAAVVVSAVVCPQVGHAGQPETKVILNGTPVPVYFNDGDSFMVLKGPQKGVRARIAGFNTLETHGPVHSWGAWHPREMYHLAVMATLRARRGVWTCKSDGKLDSYGRMLVHCHDLGVELIRLGLAHALTVTDEPADPAFVAAQREAIEHRRGIWAHGVPAFVVTSLHSVEEDVSGRGTYNRLVSTEDGHSVYWRHQDRYSECQKVCQMVYEVDEAGVAAVVAAVRGDGGATALLAGLSDEAVVQVIRHYAAFRHVSRQVPREHRDALSALLADHAARGSFGATGAPASCMVHVAFPRRYGSRKAECLR